MAHIARKAFPRALLAVSLATATALLGAATTLAASPSVAPSTLPSSIVLHAKATTLGTILVGPNGHTLYTFSLDTANKSACSGQCAIAWPPLLVAGGGTVTGPTGVTGLGTFKRADGTTQVAWNGHPLYFFIKDTAAGQTTGQGIVAFGGTFKVALIRAASAGVGASGSPVSSGAPVSGVHTPPATSTQGPDNSSGSPVAILIALLLAGLSAAGLALATLRVRIAHR